MVDLIISLHQNIVLAMSTVASRKIKPLPVTTKETAQAFSGTKLIARKCASQFSFQNIFHYQENTRYQENN